MPQADIESAILDELRHEGPCSLDDLVRRLPNHTWNQVFAGLDRLSRQGKLQIQSKRRFEYEVSVPQSFQPLTHAGINGTQSTHRPPAA